MQVPSNLFLNKIGLPGVYLPACVSRNSGRKSSYANANAASYIDGSLGRYFSGYCSSNGKRNIGSPFLIKSEDEVN